MLKRRGGVFSFDFANKECSNPAPTLSLAGGS